MSAPIGWILWTGDGQSYRSTDTSWEDAPADDVQIVVQVYEGTYRAIVQDGYDEHGYPVNRRVETHHYASVYAEDDYYWIGWDGLIASGPASEAPSGLPPGSVKRGRTMPSEAWIELYNRAMQDQSI